MEKKDPFLNSFDRLITAMRDYSNNFFLSQIKKILNNHEYYVCNSDHPTLGFEMPR